MRITWGVTLFAAVALLTGCARSRITTEIKPDGSWVRTVAFTGQEKKEGSPQLARTAEETFTFPAGSQWKLRKESKGEDRTTVFERSLAAGESLKGDVSVKDDDPSKVKLVNEVVVSRSGPGRIEYRETLTWKGAPPKLTDIKPENIADIKASLPKALATDANARAVAEKTSVLVLPALFGPGDPLLAISLMHPDLAEKRASQKIGLVLVKALEEQFGDKMKPEERRQVARDLIAKTFSSARPKEPDPSAGPPSGNSGGLTPLMFIVKMPGRVVSTNGDTDELTGEIYWALFPEAASLKPVVLTAVCEPLAK
ncbi:MAG TPA: hypothetical protein VKU01_30710 [Bryobacteraceae bacterium]|nr:hypothetical protein [Bryobacteraceae bacterium]